MNPGDFKLQLQRQQLQLEVERAWANKGFEVFWTQDGSPSLRPLLGSEMMHHRGGAFSETELIYGEVIKQGLQDGLTNFLSIGLGAGYNELFIAKNAWANVNSKSFYIESFEKDSILRTEFLSFIEANTPASECHTLYNEILTRWPEAERVKILEYLRHQYRSSCWKISIELNDKTTFLKKFHVILFDAFSSKESPELWSENFLESFLEKAADEKCLFTTYACTGALKRALKKKGFKLRERPGFHGKRDSIFAYRGYELTVCRNS